ncbi:MAG: hypothetical protein K1X71_12440 [Pirellulales bacterium]|nr:hypothetical protein [Pirellulales bacterium]
MAKPIHYGPEIDALVEPGRFAELGEGQPNQAALARLEGLKIDNTLAGQSITNRNAARCCAAALWLYHDYLDRSHTISQSIDSAEGSYWHAIMHRREGDFGNSKYWLRRVGDHSVYAELADLVPDMLGKTPLLEQLLPSGRWDPYVWVDTVEGAVRSRRPERAACVAIQQAEWRLLFDHCYRQATR